MSHQRRYQCHINTGINVTCTQRATCIEGVCTLALYSSRDPVMHAGVSAEFLLSPPEYTEMPDACFRGRDRERRGGGHRRQILRTHPATHARARARTHTHTH